MKALIFYSFLFLFIGNNFHSDKLSNNHTQTDAKDIICGGGGHYNNCIGGPDNRLRCHLVLYTGNHPTNGDWTSAYARITDLNGKKVDSETQKSIKKITVIKRIDNSYHPTHDLNGPNMSCGKGCLEITSQEWYSKDIYDSPGEIYFSSTKRMYSEAIFEFHGSPTVRVRSEIDVDKSNWYIGPIPITSFFDQKVLIEKLWE